MTRSFAALAGRRGAAISPDDATPMFSALPHAADDALRVYREASVVVGGWDEAGEDPLVDRGGHRAMLVGELYPDTSPPLELLGSLLGAWTPSGPAALRELDGAFSLLLWDPAGETLVAARDQFGGRPLYYHQGEDWVAISTEIAALLALARVPETLNEVRIAEYLALGIQDPEATLFTAVRRVPAGALVRVTGGRAELSCYWDPGSISPAAHRPTEAASALRAALEAAVARRLPEGAPAASLSGGLDSSSVVALAQRQTDLRVLAISARYPEVPASDEYQHAESVLSRYPRLCGQAVYPMGIWPPFETSTSRGTEPTWNPQHSLHVAIASASHENGRTVVLDGFGGDQAIGYGVLRLAELTRQGRLVTASHELRRLTTRISADPRLILREMVLPAVLPERARPLVRALRGALPRTNDTDLPLTPAFLDRVAFEDRRHQRMIAPRAHTVFADQVESFKSAPTAFSLDQALAAGAATGVRFRYPFLDRRLVELCLSLPAALKLRDGWTRWVLRESMRDVLPSTVAWRSDKANLTPAFVASMRGPALEWWRDLAVLHPGPLADYVDPAGLRSIAERFLEAPDAQLADNLWRAATMSSFLRTNS